MARLIIMNTGYGLPITHQRLRVHVDGGAGRHTTGKYCTPSDIQRRNSGINPSVDSGEIESNIDTAAIYCLFSRVESVHPAQRTRPLTTLRVGVRGIYCTRPTLNRGIAGNKAQHS